MAPLQQKRNAYKIAKQQFAGLLRMANYQLSIPFPLDFPMKPLYNKVTFGNNRFLEEIP